MAQVSDFCHGRKIQQKTRLELRWVFSIMPGLLSLQKSAVWAYHSVDIFNEPIYKYFPLK
jgi:hypothetical protein